MESTIHTLIPYSADRSKNQSMKWKMEKWNLVTLKISSRYQVQMAAIKEARVEGQKQY